MSEPAPAAPAAEPVAPANPAPTTETAAPASEPASTPAPAPATDAPAGATAEQVAQYLGTDVATLEKFTKFAENNGKFDGAFTKMKDAISNRQQQPTQPASQPEPAKVPEAPQNGSQKPTEGVYTTQELLMLNYFDRLSQDPKYASISKEIADGSVLVKMQQMGLNPLTQDGVNDRQLRQYLDLYAASKPAQPTSATPSADTQIDYVKIDKVTSMEEANKIELQNIQLKAQGKPEHPLTAQAKEWIRAYYKNNMDKKR